MNIDDILCEKLFSGVIIIFFLKKEAEYMCSIVLFPIVVVVCFLLFILFLK